MKGRVLIIAGSDSGGGAGIQADIKAVTMLGGYAATAVTAITVQDSKAVHAVHGVPADIIREQIKTVLADIGADCIKIGMIGSVAAGEAILAGLPPGDEIPILLDPVLVATSGDSLGGGEVAALIKERLLPRALVVTPNLPELSALTGMTAESEEEIEEASRQLLALGCGAVLAKGGHAEGDMIIDRLITEEGEHVFHHPRIRTASTHGTGCTLASAVATGLAQGMALDAATDRAISAVARAIAAAPGFGGGHGPLWHAAMAEGRDA